MSMPSSVVMMKDIVRNLAYNHWPHIFPHAIFASPELRVIAQPSPPESLFFSVVSHHLTAKAGLLIICNQATDLLSSSSRFLFSPEIC